MSRYTNKDLFAAMSEIRPQYVDDAQSFREGGAESADRAKGNIRLYKNGGRASVFRGEGRQHRALFTALKAAAAVLAVSIILPNTSPVIAKACDNIPVIGAYFHLVTFRDYSYEDAQHDANVQTGEVHTDSLNNQTAKLSAAEVNTRIKEHTNELVEEFKKSLEEGGYSSLQVKTDVVTDSDQWYVVRLNAYTASADGYEENRYYVLSKETGDLVKLSDLFKDGADYVTAISDDIRTQMKERMEKNPDETYFVDSDMPEDDFKSIDKDQQFYMNSDGDLVITFNEGDVAPMSMGAQEFVIDKSAVADILK